MKISLSLSPKLLAQFIRNERPIRVSDLELEDILTIKQEIKLYSESVLAANKKSTEVI